MVLNRLNIKMKMKIERKKMKVKLPTISKDQVKKTSIKIGLISGLTVSAIIGANAFFMENYLEFQSPIVFRTPILVHQRVEIGNLSIPTVEAVSTATESAETIKETEPVIEEKEELGLVPSSRLIAHAEARPDIYGKIVEYFGDKSVLAGELIARESSFNPLAINPTSGACGLAQALPCEKMDCELSDVDCQLKWIDEYIINRYGTLEKALDFHDKNGWY